MTHNTTSYSLFRLVVASGWWIGVATPQRFCIRSKVTVLKIERVCYENVIIPKTHVLSTCPLFLRLSPKIFLKSRPY